MPAGLPAKGHALINQDRLYTLGGHHAAQSAYSFFVAAMCSDNGLTQLKWRFAEDATGNSIDFEVARVSASGNETEHPSYPQNLVHDDNPARLSCSAPAQEDRRE
jgi:hypothetical protein